MTSTSLRPRRFQISSLSKCSSKITIILHQVMMLRQRAKATAYNLGNVTAAAAISRSVPTLNRRLRGARASLLVTMSSQASVGVHWDPHCSCAGSRSTATKRSLRALLLLLWTWWSRANTHSTIPRTQAWIQAWIQVWIQAWIQGQVWIQVQVWIQAWQRSCMRALGREGGEDVETRGASTHMRSTTCSSEHRGVNCQVTIPSRMQQSLCHPLFLLSLSARVLTVDIPPSPCRRSPIAAFVLIRLPTAGCRPLSLLRYSSHSRHSLFAAAMPFAPCHLRHSICARPFAPGHLRRAICAIHALVARAHD